jgi:hypothetical protein
MRARLADLLPRLNERDRRVAMATEAKSWGRGGISAVQRCRCRKPYPCSSGGVVVLVEDAAESVSSSDVEVVQSV